MLITKLEIKGFGKLKSRTIEFSKGLNIIYGDNEAGKSTVQAFIKAMFYGLKGGKESKEGDLPPIKRYRPWNHSAFSGFMEYTLDDGETYKVARNFENGSVKVVDSLFNDITEKFRVFNNRVCIGETHLQMDERAFESSAFIMQMNTVVSKEGRIELISKLVNTNSEADSELTSLNAQTILRETLKDFVGNEKTSKRPLDLIKKQLSEQYTKMQILNEEREKLLDEELELCQKKKDLETLKNQRDKFENMQRYYQIEGMIEQMQKDKRVAEEKLEEYNSIKNDIIDSSEHLNQIKSQISAIELHKETTDHSEMIRKLLLSEKKSEAVLIYFLGIIIAALGGVYSFILLQNNNKFIFLALLSALIECILIFLLYSKRKKKKIEDSQLSSIKQEMEDSLLKNQRLDSYNIEVKYLEDKIRELVGRNEKIYVYLTELFGKNLVSQKDIEIELEELIKSIKYKEKQKQNILEKIEGDLIEKSVLEQEIEALNKRSNQIHIDIVKIEAVTNKSSIITEINENLSLISELESEKQRLEEIQFTIKAAIEALEEAEKEIKRDVLPEVNRRMNEIALDILKAENSVVKINQDGVLNYEDSYSSGVVPVNSLSRGTIEQLAFAFRLAMTEYYENESIRLPIIIDEIFSQYDDERTGNTLNFISEYSRSRQIILFTCKKREIELAKELCQGASIIRI